MENLWAITAYFNPMHWRRRRENFHRFRRALSLPLVAVELGYDNRFDLTPDDADVVLQFPATSVMWQKERLLNLALTAVPPDVEKVVALDGDVVFRRDDVWSEVARALDRVSILHPFSHVYYLPADHALDFPTIERTQPPCAGFGHLRDQSHTTLQLCNPDWRNPSDLPPVSYGLAWAFRRELFAERGFYDAWVIGGGTRVHCFASDGLWQECAHAMQFTQPMRDHYYQWAEGFHRDVRGQWGSIPGEVAHLWHGSNAAKKFRQRYQDFAQFDFDPNQDLALDNHGAWQWNSNKPAMHKYLSNYFATRQEDGAADPVEAPLAV